MGKHLSDMSQHEIECAAERWMDHLYDLYYGPEDMDAWEYDEPDWLTVRDYIEAWMADEIPEFVREYLEYEGDAMVEAYASGELDKFGAESGMLPKDPDDEWTIVDGFFTDKWDDDELMKAVWEWMPEKHKMKLVEDLMKDADDNGIREMYNAHNRKRRRHG